MRRARSPRELVGALVACVENEDEDCGELQQLLASHLPVLAELLGVTPDALQSTCSLEEGERRTTLRKLVRAANDRQNDARAQMNVGLSLAAATQLAGLARWRDDMVELDARIVLGRGLQADRSRKFVRFAAEGYEPVTIRKGKLYEASKALRFPDLRCRLERQGLRFSWRDGRGNLLLKSQSVERAERDTVLSVVILRPSTESRRPVDVPEKRVTAASSWFESLVGLSPF